MYIDICAYIYIYIYARIYGSKPVLKRVRVRLDEVRLHQKDYR